MRGRMASAWALDFLVCSVAYFNVAPRRAVARRAGTFTNVDKA